ncbi:transcriptional regulator [uncultured Clostridium sp.]|uniref:helix-turn-helix transcriptional regulator n=1 Tax=uncultured Clostridium sp. TaxID=59620 RepID=UPI0028E86D54|nr:transcriptional regulator [uncultured Clostridium sp.]
MSKLGHLIQLLINLQYKKTATASELAEILEVDKKTIYRYINNLNAANIPVHTIKGRYGGFYIDDSVYIRPPKLTMEELQALIAMENICENSDLPFKNYLTNAVSKIKNSSFKEDYELKNLLEKNFLNIEEFGDKINLEEKITMINKSIEKGKSIKVEYFKMVKKYSIEEKIDPYSLLFKEGKWFLIAYSQLSDKVNTYEIDKIINFTPTQDIYIKPRNFSLKEFMMENWGVFDKGKIFVKIKFTKDYNKYIKNSRWCSSQKIEELDNGDIILTMYIYEIDSVKKWILSFGYGAEILEPQSLKEDIVNQAKNILNIYKINENNE